MGLYDRDYYRNDTHSPDVWGMRGSVCRKIVLVTVAVFVLQMLTFNSRTQSSTVAQWLTFDFESCFLKGQVWRLVTYAFVHTEQDLWHIVGNMLCLWFFGPDVEAIYGSRGFLRFYLSAAVCAALCQTALTLSVGQPMVLLGASGAVLGVLMLYACHFPRQKVYIMGVIPLEVRWLVGLYALYDAYPVWQQLMGGGAARGGGIAHAAHLGGFLYGFLYWKLNLRQNLWGRLSGLFSWTGLARKRRQQDTLRRGNLRVHQPERESIPEPSDFDDSDTFNQRVDEVLRKISEQGEASLTPPERALLKEAAERYKRK